MALAVNGFCRDDLRKTTDETTAVAQMPQRAVQAR